MAGIEASRCGSGSIPKYRKELTKYGLSECSRCWAVNDRNRPSSLANVSTLEGLMKWFLQSRTTYRSAATVRATSSFKDC